MALNVHAITKLGLQQLCFVTLSSSDTSRRQLSSHTSCYKAPPFMYRTRA